MCDQHYLHWGQVFGATVDVLTEGWLDSGTVPRSLSAEDAEILARYIADRVRDESPWEVQR